MPPRPNFQSEVKLDSNSGLMRVAGQSDGDPLPFDVRVYLEQKGRVAKGSPGSPNTAWEVSLSSTGFSTGPAMAFGIEVRKEPFLTTTWTQPVTIVS
jgi:hypothetical protein